MSRRSELGKVPWIPRPSEKLVIDDESEDSSSARSLYISDLGICLDVVLVTWGSVERSQPAVPSSDDKEANEDEVVAGVNMRNRTVLDKHLGRGMDI